MDRKELQRQAVQHVIRIESEVSVENIALRHDEMCEPIRLLQRMVVDAP